MNAANTLHLLPVSSPVASGSQQDEEIALDRSRELDTFLAGVERRAFRIAQFGVRDTEEALDIVQEAMIQLVRRYAKRPAEEWTPLFYRILQNRIRDWQRRRAVRAKVMGWLPGSWGEDREDDPIQTAPDPAGRTPDELVVTGNTMEALETAIAELPTRQREAFVLRIFEGLNVRETAVAMGCSQGSVKTHHSRAIHALRGKLGDHWS